MEEFGMRRNNKNISVPRLGFVFACTGLLLLGCTNIEEYQAEQDVEKGSLEDINWEERDTIFGKGGLNLFGTETKQQQGGAIGVNFYLWRASIDTISFMPVNTADAFGGVIITDWHSDPEAPNERFKLNVYILDKALRADGVRVAVFRQVQDRTGNWKDAALPSDTGTKIEDAILIRARQLRNQSIKE